MKKNIDKLIEKDDMEMEEGNRDVYLGFAVILDPSVEFIHLQIRDNICLCRLNSLRYCFYSDFLGELAFQRSHLRHHQTHLTA